MKVQPIILLAFLTACFFSSCEKTALIRQYEEIRLEAPKPAMPDMEDPHKFLSMPPMTAQSDVDLTPQTKSPIDLAWDLPDTWRAEPGSGFRFASFKSEKDSTIDCSIVILPGDVGGIDANIKRWLGQIHLSGLSESEYKEFRSSQNELKTKSGLTYLLIDFTELQQDLPADSPSMLAAILSLDEHLVFVKMTAPRDNISKEKSNFQSVLQSLRLK